MEINTNEHFKKSLEITISQDLKIDPLKEGVKDNPRLLACR